MHIDRLAILGVGLIGGSLASALKRAGVCGSIVGYGRSEVNLRRAVELGLIDEYSLSARGAVRDADLVLLATPLGANAALFGEIATAINDDAIVTDAGSVKGCVVEDARAKLGRHFSNFVPGHPIAGREKSGVEAATADLFLDHIVILTPLAGTGVRAMALVTEMWETAGAEIVTLDVERHDAILAATSHLPHMLAYTLVDCLAKMQESENIFEFAAGGFMDFTRIASSNPRMWHDICFSNRASLLDAVGRFEAHLGDLRQAIEEGNSDRILEIFIRAKTARDELLSRRERAGIGDEPA